MYNIRRATIADWETIKNIVVTVHEALANKSWYYIEDDLNDEWLKNQITNSGFALVAEDSDCNNEIVGFLLVRIPSEDSDNLGRGLYEDNDELLKVAHMEDCAVLPSNRGSQLMCRFLEEAEKYLCNGYTHLMATVHPDNYASLGSLVKCGFSILKEQDNKYGEDLPRLIMLKELEK